MVYGIYLTFKGIIKTGKEVELEQAIDDVFVKNDKDVKFLNWLFYNGFNREKAYEINRKGLTGNFSLELDGYEGSMFDYESFVKFIAPFMQPQDIEFRGEDGVYWGYRIKADGTIMELEEVITKTRIIEVREFKG